MGTGAWTTTAFADYTTTTKATVSLDDFYKTNYSAQDLFKGRHMDPLLDPKNVMRECCDSDEHPYTIPVILALDVTGSMGNAAVKTAKELDRIITSCYDLVQDVEFCIMGIGDLNYDYSPIQISQFESDIRIAQWLDKIYFERGGGGNLSEDYTAAWYMGLHHCDLDCWKRGKKGIIITLGDECPNTYLDTRFLERVTGDNHFQNETVETKDLYPLACEKFDIYHISIDDPDSCYDWYRNTYGVDQKWKNLLGQNYRVSTLDGLAATIVNIIANQTSNISIDSQQDNNDVITW